MFGRNHIHLSLCLCILGLIGLFQQKTQPTLASPQSPYFTFLPSIVKPLCEQTDFFDSPDSGWPSNSSSAPYYGYLDNEFFIFHTEANQWTGITRGDEWQADSEQLRIDVPVKSASDGVVGLLFGLNDDWTQFHSFELRAAGGSSEWRLFKYAASSGFELLAEGTSTKLFNTNEANKIELLTKVPGLFSLYFNETLMTHVPGESGRVGLVGASLSPNTDLRYDNYRFGCITQERSEQDSWDVFSIERPQP